MQIQKECFVYGLMATDNVVRYIGVTKKPLRRFQHHMACGRKARLGITYYPSPSRKDVWLAKLIQAGAEIRMIILGAFSLDEARDREIEYFNLYRTNGVLLNTDMTTNESAQYKKRKEPFKEINPPKYLQLKASWKPNHS